MALAIQYLRAIIMEIFGTFSICFFGGLVYLYNSKDTLAIAFVDGMVVFLMIYIGMDISGGFFNPAITLTFYITKDLHWVKALVYVFCQFIGSLIAGISLLLVKSDSGGMGYPMPNPRVSIVKVFIFELIATFMLLMIIYVNVRRNKGVLLTSAGSGIVIFIDILTIGALSGGAMNPARSFGPSLIDNNFLFSGFWVYLSSPFIGGLLGGLFFEACLKITNQEQFTNKEQTLIEIDKEKSNKEGNLILNETLINNVSIAN